MRTQAEERRGAQMADMLTCAAQAWLRLTGHGGPEGGPAATAQ